MALFRGNTLPHPMKNVSSTVLMDVQSKLSGGSLPAAWPWHKHQMMMGIDGRWKKGPMDFDSGIFYLPGPGNVP